MATFTGLVREKVHQFYGHAVFNLLQYARSIIALRTVNNCIFYASFVTFRVHSSLRCVASLLPSTLSLSFSLSLSLFIALNINVDASIVGCTYDVAGTSLIDVKYIC